MNTDSTTNQNSANPSTPSEQTETPDIQALSSLSHRIEMTRQNRIHASGRLLSNESFFQNINILYSCAAAIVTVLSLIFPDRNYSVASAILTVILAISIVYLNAQKFGNRAQQLQSNYIALQQLGFDVRRAIDRNDVNSREELEKRYIALLDTSENHIPHDHHHTLYQQDHREKGKAKGQDQKEMKNPKLYGYEKVCFWFTEIVSICVKGFLWILPFVYFILAAMNIL